MLLKIRYINLQTSQLPSPPPHLTIKQVTEFVKEFGQFSVKAQGFWFYLIGKSSKKQKRGAHPSSEGSKNLV